MWNFSILLTTSRLKTPEEIFDEKRAIHGVDNLKRKISHLETHSRIVWADKITFSGSIVKGAERLAWPPKKIIEDVKQYASAHHVESIGAE